MEGCRVASSTAPLPHDALARAERAQEAQSLLSHPIFGEAVLILRRSLLERLLAQPSGSPSVTELHTKAKLLDELVGELRVIANDMKFKKRDSNA
jgi:hypothetical protein